MNKKIEKSDEAPSGAIAHAPVLNIRPAAGTTRGVVLVLHGGRQNGYEQVRARHLSPSRMIPFARLISRRGAAQGLAVWSLRNRVRGWNGEERSPVQDARWALEKIRQAHPDLPIFLVGHSMGGSVALAVSDDPQVDAVVSLAPWVDKNAPIESVTGRRVLIVHGDRDKWTSPEDSLSYARRAVAAAAEMHYVRLRGVGHFMFTKVSLWHGLTASFVLRAYAQRTQIHLSSKITAPADRLYTEKGTLPVVL